MLEGESACVRVYMVPDTERKRECFAGIWMYVLTHEPTCLELIENFSCHEIVSHRSDGVGKCSIFLL